MIIVQGTFTVEPDQREAYLAQTFEMQQISRAEKGCIEYVFAADPLEANRVLLSERWETRADLDDHITALNIRRDAAREAGETQIQPIERSVVFFEGTQFQL